MFTFRTNIFPLSQPARQPRHQRKSIPHVPRMDGHRSIVSLLNTESAMKKIEENNTLVFLVDIRSNKRQIKLSDRRERGDHAPTTPGVDWRPDWDSSAKPVGRSQKCA